MGFKIAVIVGSLRAASYNRRLAHGLTRLPEAQGHDFVFPDIGTLPLYNQEQDADSPAPVVAFRDAVRAADGVIFVTPEYNRSIPGVLKNAIDHGSRPYGKSVWLKKPAAIIGVSPGKMSTAMAQQHLRNVLAALDMPTLGLPEAMIHWQEGMVADDGTLSESLGSFVGDWLKAFLALVELHRRGG